MTRAAYTGHETLTFPDYTDMEAGKTLTAEPGGVYDVAPASGRLVPDIPLGWFTPLEGEPAQVGADIPAEEVVHEPGPEAGEPQPEDGGQQQF